MRHILLSIIAFIVPSFAADFSFIGTLAQDDERRQFAFTITEPALVLMRTWSYAGGVNANGARIEAGGFDPSLSLFDSAGLLLATNRDGGCNRVREDRLTASCWDAFIATPLPRGTYQLVLTESDNTPLGPYLADPFVYDGLGNFTAAPGSGLPSGFWDYSPNRRNNSYALDITGVDSARLRLAPSIGSLVNGASWQVGPIAPNTILTLFYGNLPGVQPLQALIDGQSVEVLYNGPTQLNFVVPPTAVLQTSVLLQISSAGNLLLSTPQQIVNASPALFTVNQSGTGQASVLNQDYSYNGPNFPAARGSIIMAYGTGFGVANPAGQDGLSWLTATVSATIAGLPADVTFAGLAPGYTPGLQQINIRIPEGAPVGAAVSLRLQVGVHSTQMGTTVAVE